MQSLREEIIEYCREFYGTEPDYPWDSDPQCAVLRHKNSKKWYGLIMNIPAEKLGLEPREVDILNIKCDPSLIGSLILKEGCFRAYHMSKEHWLTVLLDGTLPIEEIIPLIELSRKLTADKKDMIFGK